ncbi:hypothetical protein DFH08DRAFT_967758 [Mycena albidolilacea]|uniref:Uncharacterized protein n=1 Tax=Mycena albidolilacea TaxID=1033008 RepID=A0AAD7EJX8_9AGAR|nr:hypothetical protein DFH08DRAFT_967758 [Mycena albidolilacea]
MNDDDDGNKAEAGTSDGVFDYTELEARTTEESVNEQKMSFDRSVAPYVEGLKKRWPENGAGKRIYTDELGYQWELDTIWLSIWASHIMLSTSGKQVQSMSPLGCKLNGLTVQPAPAGGKRSQQRGRDI